MRIKFLVSMAGAGFTRNPGDVADIEEAEARRLIERGYAQPVRGRPPSKAVKQAPETAVEARNE